MLYPVNWIKVNWFCLVLSEILIFQENKSSNCIQSEAATRGTL